MAASESANGADRPASDATHPRTGAVSPQLVHSENAENDVFDKVGREGTRNEGAAGPALSAGLVIDVTAAQGVADLRPAVEVAPRKQRSRGKKVGAISHVSHADEMSLDEEIRVLRGQLAVKLKLQNAQLRKMLERFER
ncbi:hypothetical protein FHX14_002528 [Rhizobium sp. BK619]|nr:hypothetical protein [Rhizobium sp. BK619]